MAVDVISMRVQQVSPGEQKNQQLILSLIQSAQK